MQPEQKAPAVGESRPADYRKFLALEAELNRTVYERSVVIRGLLLALLASETFAPIPVVLIGPAGTSKSMLIRALCEAIGGDYYSWLLTPSTKEEEVFGPIRTRLMVEEDRVERNPTGKLPAKKVVFLDEFFNGSETLLNGFLPVLADGEWFNGTGPEPLPLRLFVAASNRVPDISGQQVILSALWDRIVLRYQVRRIQEPKHFRKMLLDVTRRRQDGSGNRVTPATRISLEEVDAAREQVRRIDVRPALGSLEALWAEIGDQFAISDRRWGQYVALLQAQAFLSGRTHAEPQDLAVLQHCLWNRPEEAAAAAELVARFLTPWAQPLENLMADAEEQVRLFWRIPESDTDERLIQGMEVQQKLAHITAEVEALLAEERQRTGQEPTELVNALKYLHTERERIGRARAGIRTLS